MANGLVHVYINSCHALKSKDETHKLNSKVQLQIGQSSTQSTSVEEDSYPVFQQEFVFLVYNPYVDNLDIKVIDTINGIIIGSDYLHNAGDSMVCLHFPGTDLRHHWKC